MKLCTCNNCGKVYEDKNAGKESKEYPDVWAFLPLELFYEDPSNLETGFYGCPKCEDDGWLMDNINEGALSRIDLLIVNKMIGVDCTEDDSAFIKGWLRDTIIQPGTDDVERLESIQHYFPQEYGEHLDEEKGEWEPPDPETKVFNAMQGGTEQ